MVVKWLMLIRKVDKANLRLLVKAITGLDGVLGAQQADFVERQISFAAKRSTTVSLLIFLKLIFKICQNISYQFMIFLKRRY